MTAREALQSLTGYPIPADTISRVGVARGLALDSDIDSETLASSAYRLAMADVYHFLVTAPNVSQGGIYYSFSSEERERFLAIARSIYQEEGITSSVSAITTFGYKGSRL